jgi:hypothetical protein
MPLSWLCYFVLSQDMIQGSKTNSLRPGRSIGLFRHLIHGLGYLPSKLSIVKPNWPN